MVFDLTSIPAASAANGIHWPTAQATSIENVVFQMSAAPGTNHVGIFCESGKSGFVILRSSLQDGLGTDRLHLFHAGASRIFTGHSLLFGTLLRSSEQAPQAG